MNTISNHEATKDPRAVFALPEFFYDILKEDEGFEEACRDFNLKAIIGIAERKLSGYDLEMFKGYLMISRVLLGSPVDNKSYLSVHIGRYLDDHREVGSGFKSLVSTLVDKLKSSEKEFTMEDKSALYDIVVEGNYIFVVMKEGFGDIWASNSYTRFYRDILKTIMDKFGLATAMRTEVTRSYLTKRLAEVA